MRSLHIVISYNMCELAYFQNIIYLRTFVRISDQYFIPELCSIDEIHLACVACLFYSCTGVPLFIEHLFQKVTL
jgi:hypothetical protein